MTIWECALTGKWKLELNQVIALASEWLYSTIAFCEISGKANHIKNRATES